MDEFDKIREISEDLTSRREPTFSGFSSDKDKAPLTSETVLSQTVPAEQNSDEGHVSQDPVYNFSKPFEDKIDFVQIDTIEEKPFTSMKIHLIALVLFILILALVLAGFLMFSDDQNDLDEVVTITASSTPIKETPEQAGGINIPDQDKLVYNRIRSDNLVTKVESLFPEPEKPVLPQILAIEKNAPTEDFVEMKDVKPVNPLDDSTKQLANTDTSSVSVVVPMKEEAKPAALVQETIATEQETKKEVVPLPIQNTKVEKQITPMISGGVWRAQLFSSNNKVAVEQGWKRILSKNKDLLAQLPFEILKADIPGKGAFYRLKVGQFPTRDQVEALCVKLRSRKQDCIPAK